MGRERTLTLIFRKFLHRFRRSYRQDREPENPIRAELFSIERLEQHAESLATAQRVIRKPSRGYTLLRRVKDNRQVLIFGYRRIVQFILGWRSFKQSTNVGVRERCGRGHFRFAGFAFNQSDDVVIRQFSRVRGGQ